MIVVVFANRIHCDAEQAGTRCRSVLHLGVELDHVHVRAAARARGWGTGPDRCPRHRERAS